MKTARRPSQIITPEQNLQVVQTQFEDYLKLDQDEDENQNRFFLNQLEAGKIQINFEHLVSATKMGHLGLLTGIFSQLAHPEKTTFLSKDAKGFTLLHHLAKTSDLSSRLQNDQQKITQLTNLFLANHVHINALTNQGQNTALILAIRYNNTALFTALIAKNARLKTNSLIEHPLAHINHYNAVGKNALDYVMDELKKDKSEEEKEQIKTCYLVPLIRSGITVVDRSKPLKPDDAILKIVTVIKLMIEHGQGLSEVLQNSEEVFYIADQKLSDKESLERLEKFNMKYNLFYAFLNINNSFLIGAITQNQEILDIHSTKNNLLSPLSDYKEFFPRLPKILIQHGITEQDQISFGQFLERYYDRSNALRLGITDNINIDDIKYSFFGKYDQISQILTRVLITFLEASGESKNLPESIKKFSDPEYDKFKYLLLIKQLSGNNKTLYSDLLRASIDNGFNPFTSTEISEELRSLLPIQISLGSYIASNYNNGRLVLTFDHRSFSQENRENLIIDGFFQQEVGALDDVKEISFYFSSTDEADKFLDNVFRCFLGSVYINCTKIARSSPGQIKVANKIIDGSMPISIYRDGQMFYHSSYGFANYHGEFDTSLKPDGLGVMRFNFNLDRTKLGQLYQGLKGAYDASGFEFPFKINLQYDIYIGSFKEGLFHGNGFLKFSDGAYYEGSFKKGLLDGSGKIVNSDGQSHEVFFQKGKLVVNQGDKKVAIPFTIEDGLSLKVTGINIEVKHKNPNGEIVLKTYRGVSLATDSAKDSEVAKPHTRLARFIAESFNNFLKDFIANELDKITEFSQLKLELERLENSFIIISEAVAPFENSTTDNTTFSQNIEKRKSQLPIYRQRIDQIRKFFETAKADLLKTIRIKNAESTLEYDQFQGLIELDFLKAKFQLLKSTQTIVDNDKASSNLITPFVESLQSKLISSITTETTITRLELNEIKRILNELYSLTIDQTAYQQIQDHSRDLLSAVLLPISPSLSEQSEFVPPREKTKTTAPEIKAWELKWNSLSAKMLERLNKEVILRHGELIATEEPKTSPRIVQADFSLSELSNLSKLLNGIDLETTISNSSAPQTQYLSLNHFRSGCAPINTTQKTKRELQKEFHESLEKLVTDISTSENYDEADKANLTSHIYNLNAYCIGGQNWQEYVLRNYERLSVQGRLVGLTTGLGHASSASDDELTQMIWTISQLQQIHDNHQESTKDNPAKTLHPLSINKFQDHLSTIFFAKSPQNPTQTSRGETTIVDFSDQDYLRNLVDYFASISKQNLKPPLDSIRQRLNEFIKENLMSISQDTESSFTQDFKTHINTVTIESDVDFIKKIQGSEFDLIQPISESAQKNESMNQLRDFCKSKYQTIHAQYESVEREKSRSGQLKSLTSEGGTRGR